MREATKGELSKKNPYYIPKYRYYELKYRCLQYKEWEREYKELGLYLKSIDNTKDRVNEGKIPDPVVMALIERSEFEYKMSDIDKALGAIPFLLIDPIKFAVTNGVGWEKVQALFSLTCTRDEYYNAYHKFFFMLNKYVK